MSFNSEVELIGTILNSGITPDASDSLESLSEKMFTSTETRGLFIAMRELHLHSMPVTMGAILERHTGLYEAASQYLKSAVSDKAIKRLTTEVIESYNANLSKRMLEKALVQITKDPQNYGSHLTTLDANLKTIESPDSHSEALLFKTYASGYIDLMQSRLEGKESATGLDIGVGTLLNRTDFVIIGAPSGMGKTALSLYMAEYIARNSGKVLYFSLEMEGMQLFEREVTRNGRMTITALKDPLTHDLDMSALTNGVSKASELPIYIDDASKLDLYLFKQKARKFKAKNPDLKAIFIDYLTLMQLPDGDRRDIQITEAGRQLKLFAKEIKTPIILLSQVNKGVGKSGREPVKEDLRDGAIENDADKIFMPFRDDVANPSSPNKGLAKIIKAKVRDGDNRPHLMRFENGNFYAAGDGAAWSDVADDDENGKPKKYQRN